MALHRRPRTTPSRRLPSQPLAPRPVPRLPHRTLPSSSSTRGLRLSPPYHPTHPPPPPLRLGPPLTEATHCPRRQPRPSGCLPPTLAAVSPATTARKTGCPELLL
ncbi:hypothetical protein SETIT_5G368300v2 [Setaria italica]|uniref:Uncharacterized protein n=1 Tax=Setaria italica TaxID=4555 RepID=A0A368RCZ0_SETIT|nr:hypothetical protein SETIT_5G368300v2 [Setaria italica]